MSRTLILNVSASAQTLPAGYGGYEVAVGFGHVVSAEASVVVAALGGFAAMDGVWVVYPVSTDTATGSIDVAANGVAMLATFVGTGTPGSGGPVSWSDITGKPSFAPVAFSGEYDALSNKPVLAPVAESGNYSDLNAPPTIPSAGNTTPPAVSSVGGAGVASTWARSDHQHAHGTLSGGAMHALVTTVAAGFMSAADKIKLDGLSTVASSGSYNDLSDKPSLFDGTYESLTGKPSLFSGSYDDLTGKPDLSGYLTSIPDAGITTAKIADAAVTDAKIASVAASKVTGLSAAATSGSYNDLTNKPDFSVYLTSIADGSITTAKIADSAVTSAKINSVAAAKVTGLATVATSGSFNDLSNKPSKTYDLMSSARGSLTVGTTLTDCLMPRAATFSALTQTGGAVVKIQVDGADITYPKSVTAGQVVSFVVTVAGTNNSATLAGTEA